MDNTNNADGLNHMNIKTLIRSVSEQTDLTHRQSEEAVRATLHSIREAIAEGQEIYLKGLLHVKRVHRKERVFFNPITPTPTKRPARTQPTISLSGPLVKEATQYL